MHDTTREAAAVQANAVRNMSGEARVALALEASDWLQRLARVRTDALANTRPEPPVSPDVRLSADRS